MLIIMQILCLINLYMLDDYYYILQFKYTNIVVSCTFCQILKDYFGNKK